jgi:amino-acid N-acetyltransferase
MTPEIRPAKRKDLDDILKLLEEVSLPTLGVSKHLHNYLVARDGETLVGAIGMELYGETGLLRSAAVSPGWQGKGVGGRLYDALIGNARELGIDRLVLLTNTAEKYFARRGFKTIDRATLSGPVTLSVEFTDACPSHAVCMMLELGRS